MKKHEKDYFDGIYAIEDALKSLYTMARTLQQREHTRFAETADAIWKNIGEAKGKIIEAVSKATTESKPKTGLAYADKIFENSPKIPQPKQSALACPICDSDNVVLLENDLGESLQCFNCQHKATKDKWKKPAENLVHQFTTPDNLKELKHALNRFSDEHLVTFKVFKFTWGDKSGTCDWRRKDSPKQYWARLRDFEAGETEKIDKFLNSVDTPPRE